MIEFGVADLPVDAVNLLLRTVIRPSVAPVGSPPPAAPSTPATAPPSLPTARTPLPTTPPAPEPPAAEPGETDAATGLLTREGLSRRLQAARTGNRPVSLTLVRLDPVEADNHPRTDRPSEPRTGDAEPAPAASSADALTTLAGRVRDMAPQDAELARSDGQELAALLPQTTRDQAEEAAATIRHSPI